MRITPTKRSRIVHSRWLIGFIVLAGVLAGLVSFLPASARNFDFYVLSLSWSPSYCERTGQQNSRQCDHKRNYAFIVHGLWPQRSHDWPSFCSQKRHVPKAIEDKMLDIMPSRSLIRHQWAKHGTCSDLDITSYFEKVRRAYNTVSIPKEFHKLQKYISLNPMVVEEAFIADNKGLKPEMISVTCDKKFLTEVRICMRKDLSFTPCPQVDKKRCSRKKVAMPPVR